MPWPSSASWCGTAFIRKDGFSEYALAVPQITMIIIQKFKITSGSNEEENKNHLTSYQPRQHLNMFRNNKSGIN